MKENVATLSASLGTPASQEERAHWIRRQLPTDNLFEGHDWRVALEPFALDPRTVHTLELLGRVLLKFYQAVNRLYRLSAEGRQPSWVADLLDRGKPETLIRLQRSDAFRQDVPRVIRPDLLVTDDGFCLTELDSVPGGIGVTAWLNQTYCRLGKDGATSAIVGQADGMLRGFDGIFGDAARVHLFVSEESATYRPEMKWLATQLSSERFEVRGADFDEWQSGDAVYRFFELFDLANVPAAGALFAAAQSGQIRLTPPPKTCFEEKALLALLWNRNLRGFWRQELGEGFLKRLLPMVPYTWVMDPTPLPPHAAYPELELTDWNQLKSLSQKERNLILKISGYAETAWGSRGVFLGSDMSVEAWSEAVDLAVRSWPESPYVLQRYHKPKLVPASYFDFNAGQAVSMEGRVRLCPYYFVHGDGLSARPHLGGVLATICPADKKIIHGMRDAILAPCAVMEAPVGAASQGTPMSARAPA